VPLTSIFSVAFPEEGHPYSEKEESNLQKGFVG
jgi:hypothetical protein